jgi:hypothetical protein
LLKSKKAFLLSSLLDKMFSYLPEYVPKDLTTRKLQRKLESHYGESIVTKEPGIDCNECANVTSVDAG